MTHPDRAACIVGVSIVPDFERFLNSHVARLTRIMGVRGPLSMRKSRKVLRRAGLDPAAISAMERHFAIEQAIAETPLVAGNKTRLLRDGEETFRAMFAAITAAKDHVHLEYYILEDIESDGMRLSDLLVSKARAGVAVHVIYDSFGSSNTPDAFFEKLAAGGVKLLSFNPVNPLKAKHGYKPNDRDHRKILIADGRIGIVGGINLSTTYISTGGRGVGKSGQGGGAGGRVTAEAADSWRDTDLEITGPAVRQLQTLFLKQWAAQHGPPLRHATFHPEMEEAGTEVVRIIGSTPDHHMPRYYVTFLSAIRNADKHIYVMAAYFVPPRALRRGLRQAARRGVDVRLLLPGKSDASIAVAAQRSYYSSFLRAGVKIYEVRDYIQHTKAVTIDGVWTAIGSSNLDHRSVLFNDEVDAVVLGTETADAMEKLFLEDSASAREITRAEWQKRPWKQRLYEFFARFGEKLL